MAAKKTTRTRAQETTLRHLWLAGLGAVAVVRRDALKAANDAVARMESLKQQAGKLAGQTQTNLRDSIASAREQGEAQADRFSAEVEARLAPVLTKLGLRPQAKGKSKLKSKSKPQSKPRASKVGSKTVAKRTRTTTLKATAQSIPGKRAAAKRATGKA